MESFAVSQQAKINNANHKINRFDASPREGVNDLPLKRQAFLKREAIPKHAAAIARDSSNG